jgi:hyperosmotically inducible protein
VKKSCGADQIAIASQASSGVHQLFAGGVMMKKHSRSTVLFLALTLMPPLAIMTLSGCSRTINSAASRTTPDDATITTRVKTALLNDTGITAKSKIDVETVKGVVTLTGSVTTPDERDRAMAIARKISGVSDVKSALQVQ